MSRADELNRFVLWHIDLHKNEYGNLVYFNQAERIITELEQKLAERDAFIEGACDRFGCLAGLGECICLKFAPPVGEKE